MSQNGLYLIRTDKMTTSGEILDELRNSCSKRVVNGNIIKYQQTNVIKNYKN